MSTELMLEEENTIVEPICLRWSKEEVGRWIKDLGFPDYEDCFVSNYISGIKLIAIDSSTLPSIGITDFEHIKVIAAAIRSLLGIDFLPWNRSISLPPRQPLGMYLERKFVSGSTSKGLNLEDFLLGKC